MALVIPHPRHGIPVKNKIGQPIPDMVYRTHTIPIPRNKLQLPAINLIPFFILSYNTELTQLCMSMAIVIGPTPPGTGVIALVCGATLSKSTSPHSLLFSSR